MQELYSIVAAGNTYNPSLLVLREKGYELSREDAGEVVLWTARKGNYAFTGYSPPELLGIVALWEALGDNWNRQNPDLISEIAEQSELG